MITNSFKDLNKTTSSLSIQLGLNGFSFFVSSQQLNSDALQLNLNSRASEKEVSEALSDFILKNESLQQNFSNVFVTYTDYIFNLVPNTIFDKDQTSNYLEYNVKPLVSDSILYQEVHDTTVIYTIPTLIKTQLEQLYNITSYNHLSSILLKHILKEYKQNIGPRIFIYTYQDFFYLYVLNGQELQFCNTFPYQSNGDFLYYLIFSLEQLNLDPAKETLHLLNNINEETLKTIEPFIYDIKVLSNSLKNFVHLRNLQV